MNPELTLQEIARRALATAPERPAIQYRGDWYDWGWMRDNGATVLDLLEVSGVSREKPVGVVPRNRPTSAAALLALIADGRSVRIIFAFQSSRMLAQDVTRCEISALIASDEDFSAPVVDALDEAGLCGISLDEEAGIGLATRLDDAVAAPRDRSVGATASPIIEILTSGATGPPMNFGISHEVILQNLLASNVSYAEDLRSSDLEAPALVFFPLSTIAGLYAYLPPALRGRPVILQETFDLDGWLDYVARYRPHRMTLPTAEIESLLKRQLPPDALAGVRYVGTGPAPIDLQSETEFEKRFGIPLLVSYGATEFGGPVVAMTSALREQWGARKRGSAGMAWGGANLRVVDPKSNLPLPPGGVGILEVISPAVGQGWVRTGDLVMIDADGFLFHRGRADGAITRGGFSMLPEVIESVLLRHPQVSAAVVVGLPHQRLGELPVAAIVPKDVDHPPTVKDLEEFLRDRVFAAQIPVAFKFVRDLPLRRSKVDSRKVLALFQRSAR